MTEWFEEWFGEEYLHLYPHRDEADAERLVDLLCNALDWKPGWKVLDVACGAGRHMASLQARGARPIGIDLSLTLLRKVREVTDRPVARADMRCLPIRPRSMDLTLNLFTSFGYFERDEDHVRTIGEMLDTVRPGGWFAIDFLNADRVRQRLVPEETVRFESAVVRITRQITTDDRFVVKAIHTQDGRTFKERVRLLPPLELESLLTAQGARIVHRWGDYNGSPPGEGTRCILLAQVLR